MLAVDPFIVLLNLCVIINIELVVAIFLLLNLQDALETQELTFTVIYASWTINGYLLFLLRFDGCYFCCF